MRILWITLLGFGLAAGFHLQAQEETIAPASPVLSSDQLNELLGPVALYPDPLISLILPASTVPSDIVLANRFITSGGSVDELEDKPWDPSVKGLARYPDTLKWMDENLDWTSQVGDAFTEQPEQVMAAIQALRAKAKAMGNLVDTPEERIVQDDDNIRVIPAEPDAIYVPSYDPQVVYVQSSPSVPLVYFSQPYGVGPWLDYDCDWHHRRLYRGEWSRGWDYHRDHGHSHNSQAFINNNIRNSQVWHVNMQRRHNDARRRAEQQRVANRGPFHIHHPGRNDIARHQGETIRRAEVAGRGAPDWNKVHHRGSGDRGHIAAPRSLPPEVRKGPSRGRGEGSKPRELPQNLGSVGGRSQNHSHVEGPRSKKQPHSPGPRSNPKAIGRPHSPGHQSMPKAIGRPHSQVHKSMPKAVTQPHSQAHRPMPKPIARPHSQVHKAAPKAISKPHPQAKAPAARGHGKGAPDDKKKHK